MLNYREETSATRTHVEIMERLLIPAAATSLEALEEIGQGWVAYQTKTAERMRREISLMATQLLGYNCVDR